jgi:hypothetical protein
LRGFTSLHTAPPNSTHLYHRDRVRLLLQRRVVPRHHAQRRLALAQLEAPHHLGAVVVDERAVRGGVEDAAEALKLAQVEAAPVGVRTGRGRGDGLGLVVGLWALTCMVAATAAASAGLPLLATDKPPEPRVEVRRRRSPKVLAALKGVEGGEAVHHLHPVVEVRLVVALERLRIVSGGCGCMHMCEVSMRTAPNRLLSVGRSNAACNRPAPPHL